MVFFFRIVISVPAHLFFSVWVNPTGIHVQCTADGFVRDKCKPPEHPSSRADRLHLSFAGHPRRENQPNPSPDQPEKVSSVMLGGSSTEETFSGTHTSIKLPL